MHFTSDWNATTCGASTNKPISSKTSAHVQHLKNINILAIKVKNIPAALAGPDVEEMLHTTIRGGICRDSISRPICCR